MSFTSTCQPEDVYLRGLLSVIIGKRLGVKKKKKKKMLEGLIGWLFVSLVLYLLKSLYSAIKKKVSTAAAHNEHKQ